MEVKQLKKKDYSLAEYLEMVERSQQKLEYLDGQILMMAGASKEHNRITKNCLIATNTNPNQCEVFLSETAVSVRSRNSIFFPDLTAVCDKPVEREEGGIERILNPSLLIEVLSKSTSRYDRSEKFNAYKALPSFKEYVTIDSSEYFVYTFYKEDNGLWRIGNYSKLAQEVEIITLGMKVPMSVIYAGVDFPEETLPQI